MNWLRKQFRERPVVAWGGTAALVGVIVAVVVIVLVKGNSEPKDTPISCTVYENSGTLRLTVHAKVTKKEAAEGCGTSTKGLSSAGTYFVVGTPPIPEEEPRLICALTSPDKPLTILVEEVPSIVSKGERYCGALAGKGWTQAVGAPEIGPGQREYDEAQAVEQARQAKIEEREALLREREEAAEHARERAVARCDQAARTKEKEELHTVERESREQAEAAGSENEGYERENEGYEEEDEVYERELKAEEACERQAEAEPEASEEFR